MVSQKLFNTSWSQNATNSMKSSCKLRISIKICSTVSKQIHCRCKPLAAALCLVSYLLSRLLSVLTYFWQFRLLYFGNIALLHIILWDIKMERYVSLVPQSHGCRNLARLLISSASYWIKLFHVGKVTQQYFRGCIPKRMLRSSVKCK